MKKTPDIVVVPDIHGERFWDKLFDEVDVEKVRKIIFLGDYFDSFHINYDEQMKNFMDIVRFKDAFPDKVELLIGNHDIHYFTFNPCSGFSETFMYQIRMLIKPLLEDGRLKLFHIENDILFSHAGLTKTFLKNVCANFNMPYINDKSEVDITNEDIKQATSELNGLLYHYPEAFEFQRPKKLSAPLSMYGDNVWQSPLWVRPKSLQYDAVNGFKQIVGHTEYADFQHKVAENGMDLHFIDCKKIFLI